ncbi:MAG: thioredoxin family protein [Bacteroidales bacterium]|nr:thioredoxin family protein [Bacteroidales bacterium]
MKQFLSFLVVLMIYGSLSAQLQFSGDFVKWTYSHKWISETEVQIDYKAAIDKPWHLYDANIPAGGPIATNVTLNDSLIYKTTKPLFAVTKPISVYDEAFAMQLNYFADKAHFRQILKPSSSKKQTLNGAIEFMICDDSKCLPPDRVEFAIAINAYDGATKNTETNQKSNDSAAITVATSMTDTNKVTATTPTDLTTTTSSDSNIETAKTESTNTANKSLIIIFTAGFLGGLIALLTPCVFPMIPMTVSFFLKKEKGKGVRDALIYGFSIIAIYLILGILVSSIWGPDSLNALSTNPIFNIVFFLLLVVFAISFLGAFEIQLPTSWANYFDKKADSSTGFISILFMAFTLAIVSFSCTGPIIGTLLVEATVSGSKTGPIVGMAGFAIALALPFTLFALFPSWLNSLPKSGGWLNSVKVVLGFLELALALKFLSTADLVAHWGILPRETFLVLWIVIFALLGFYLLGKLKFAHDSDLKYISVPRLFFAIASLSFALYMIPGLWGAPLKAISAFSPPQHTQDFDLFTRSLQSSNTNKSSENVISKKKFSETFHCPHNLNCFFDYEEGLEYAKQVNKPILIDFTGWGCVNCRNMEVKVWSDSRVLSLLENDYVLISLYVDDNLELPENEQFIWNIGERTKKVKTIGNKWSHFQATRFGTNSQPYYVILDHNEKMLLTPRVFDLNIDGYIDFLKQGIVEFKK